MFTAKHGGRVASKGLGSLDNLISANATRRSPNHTSRGAAWVCISCQSKAASTSRTEQSRSVIQQALWQQQQPFSRVRSFSHSTTTHDEQSRSPRPTSHAYTTSTTTGSPPSHEDLPSHTASRRSHVSKRLQAFMDDMLAKAAVAGQRVNTYTGTDYSGIENLRRQISEQEQVVKSAHARVMTAKTAFDAAHAAQAASQKEVVSLLERKSSWAGSDLDRYTSLIRSEHGHEQAVASARQTLASAERELEEARTELERKERKQYHEEQVWSDTIRRNSTWVTFGLMGLNILLLVGNIGVVEPWRRRRLVREVREALEENAAGVAAGVAAAGAEVGLETVAEREVDAVVEPVAVSLKEPHGEAGVLPKEDSVLDVEVKGNTAAVVLEPPSTEQSSIPRETPIDISLVASLAETIRKGWIRTKEVYTDWWQAPLGDGQMTLRRVEVTSIALEGAAAGLVLMGCMIVLLRPR